MLAARPAMSIMPGFGDCVLQILQRVVELLARALVSRGVLVLRQSPQFLECIIVMLRERHDASLEISALLQFARLAFSFELADFAIRVP
jgi:hypothetical protein